jgi:GNAT superfamily N-acetyltransferase
VIVTVREFLLEQDLERACGLGVRAREDDPAVEPFAQRLPVIASGPRALLELWQVAEGEDGKLYGIAFAAVREARRRKPTKAEHQSPMLAGLSAPEITEPADAHLSIEVYGVVDRTLRRQGLGRQLFDPVVQFALNAPGTTLRARIREAPPAEKFLKALGFTQSSAQLSLARSAEPPAPRETPGVLIKPLDRRDRRQTDAYRKLSNDAWADAPDAFETRADELEQLLSDLGRVLLLAEMESKAAGYLSAVWLGETLAIEEVAVLPQYRRFGIGRALVTAALAKAQTALLTVSERNAAARALYKGLGFQQVGRRLV